MTAQLLVSRAAGGAPKVSVQMAQELAASIGVCGRRVIRRVLDCETGTEQLIGIPCGSTRESRCPACAHKARVLRMQQCAEGWHLTHEPEQPHRSDDHDQTGEQDAEDEGRRVRSTRRRDDAPDLPRVPVEDRTVGQVFTAPDGHEYRPSMFLTLTLPSYGPIRDGAPVDPSGYDYRRAALDAVLFPRLMDRFFQNLRRCAGYKVQYFAAIEAQHRLAPHLHAAIRGAIPRQTLRQVIQATYLQVWWPPFDTPVYRHRLPEWEGDNYLDPDSGRPLPTWDQALAELDADDSAVPAHVMRFGRQYDMQGIIAPSAQADRAVRYLTKYLTKAISDTHHPDLAAAAAYERHIDRLHAELRYLPCSPRCANWLRYGVQPHDLGPGLVPGHCTGKAHDRENLGLGGRRVLVSRHWSGKTLSRHRADRADVVRETLLAAGFEPPQVDRLAPNATTPDGQLRYRWSDVRPDARTYTRVLLNDIAEHQTWKAQYQQAKTTTPVHTNSATTGPAP